MNQDNAPKVGQIVDHHFLWVDEAAAGQVEGRKLRPCLIIAVEAHARAAAPRVSVLPITSQKPRAGSSGVEIPNDIKVSIGLDRVRPAWVMIDDANVFDWPGFDLVPQPSGGFVRGTVTRGFFKQVCEAVLAVRSRGRPRAVNRDQT